MKVLFVFPHFITPGGAANVVLQFARALQERQHVVEIVCARVSTGFRQQNPDLSFHELNIPSSNSFLYWAFLPFWRRRIDRQLKSYREYILFPHVLPSNWWVWMYKKRYKDGKVVWYCNEPSAFIHSKSWINAIPVAAMKWGAKALNPLLKRFDISLERENDIVICNSKFTGQQYGEVYGRDPQAIIYPPLRIEPVLPLKNKEKLIITVARLTKFKKVDVLIRAFSKLSQQQPDVKLVIVGDGEDKRRLEHLVKDLGIGHNVKFEGSVSKDRLETLYQSAKVCVICAVDEPFGLVPIESMMYGTPVIAHDSGGPRETVSPGLTGFLYHTEDELVRFTQNLFDLDENEYLLMQERCIKSAASYDIETAVIQLEKLLQSVNP